MVANVFSIVICLASGKADIMAGNKEFRGLSPGSCVYVKHGVDPKLVSALLKDKSKVYLQSALQANNSLTQ